MDRTDWVKRLFETIDKKDENGFASFLTDDAVFRFGNADPVQGKKPVRDTVGGFFESIAGLRHDVERVWTQEDAVICDGHVTYTRHDNTTLKVRFADVFVMRGDLVREYNIYIDVSTLYNTGP